MVKVSVSIWSKDKIVTFYLLNTSLMEAIVKLKKSDLSNSIRNLQSEVKFT